MSGPSASSSLPKPRSCVVCRSRKVKCDKQSPCSNCRRGNIACVFPSTDRPPRWARRLATNTATSNISTPQDADLAARLAERVRNLESLVKDLRGQLEQVNASAGSSPRDHGAEDQRGTSPASTAGSVQQQLGRLVLQDPNHSRYVSSGFWSRVNDELDGLKADANILAGEDIDSSGDEASAAQAPSLQELDRTPLERHAFLFGHNLRFASTNLREFHPLPSQIPFLLDVFSENVNSLGQVVHMPTITKMVRGLRGSGMTSITPASEALMFSIYYAAIASMDEDDVLANFGSSKPDLSLRYRVGMEHALAKADFLNAPDLTIVQALSIFLSLVRRHDSPRFVWMMTGLVIRIAQYLGLQRDGTHFDHLTPFEIEMRRRVWWILIMLDIRASEDQGTDLTIAAGSFDTRVPLNLNDADIGPESTQTPTERDSVTDMSFARINFGVSEVVRQMMSPGIADGAAGLEDQSRLLNDLSQKFEQGYFPYATDSENITYWVGVTIARLVVAKMTLIAYLPILFTSPGEEFSDEIRNRLLVAAIEVAEYNHALNAETAVRKWRWIYQTYTHWHAIVYLLINISRRPWSPIIERAWVALHSSWLIPAQAPMDKNLRIWVPLRKLMNKARKYREAELSRLRGDPQAAARLEIEDQNMPTPSSSPITGSSTNDFRERWRHLWAIPDVSGNSTQVSGVVNANDTNLDIDGTYASLPAAVPREVCNPGMQGSNMSFQPLYTTASGGLTGHVPAGSDMNGSVAAINEQDSFQKPLPQYNPASFEPTNWAEQTTMGYGSGPWLWADVDLSVDVFSHAEMDAIDAGMKSDSDVDWYGWLETAKGMEMDMGLNGNTWT